MSPTSPPTSRPVSCAAVWAPWLAAPVFALLPIGGCGLAGGWRTAQADPPPAPAADAVADVRVVPVLTGVDPQVAWRPAAN